MNNIVSQIVYGPVQQNSDLPAIITRTGDVFTYAQLATAVGQVTGHLRLRGVQPGRTVGVSMGSHPLHLLTMLALAQVGAVYLPLHPAVPPERRRLAADRFGAGCVVSDSREFALEGLAFIGLDSSEFRTDCPSDPAVYPAAPDHPMQILVTSGTSGNPKGMVWTHGNAARRNQTWEPGGSCPKRVLQMDVNFFIGSGPALRALAHGDTIVFPQSMAMEHVLITLITQKVTHAYLSRHQASLLASLVGGNAGPVCPDLLSLRVIGEHLTAPMRNVLSQRVTPNIYTIFGGVEAGVSTIGTPEMLARHPDTVGRATDWAEVQVVDGGGAVVLAGTEGEVRVRSTQMVHGYYRDEERTRLRFRDGWYYSGDRGRLDAEGLLFLTGRVDDLINLGGFLIDGDDVERTLRLHPAVIDAGVFTSAAPDGQVLLSAAVLLNDPQRLEELHRFAQSQLGPLAPARYVPVRGLPRTADGKLDRGGLSSAFPLAGPDAAPSPLS